MKFSIEFSKELSKNTKTQNFITSKKLKILNILLAKVN